MDRSKAQKVLKKFLKIIDDMKVSYEEIIVFGSQIVGLTHEHSDVDVCIVFKTQNQETEKILGKISYAAGKADLLVDISSTTLKKLKTDRISPFLNEVRKGVVISKFLKI